MSVGVVLMGVTAHCFLKGMWMSESRSLFMLVRDFQALDELLIESGGEITPVLEEWMSLNAGDVGAKVDSYKLYIDHLDARAEYFKRLEAQAYEAKKLFENHIKRLKENLKQSMIEMGVDELRGQDFRWKLSQLKPKLVIEDAKAIPAKFTTETIVFEPDKEKIMAAIESGETIAGCRIEPVQSLKNYVNSGSKKVVKSE